MSDKDPLIKEEADSTTSIDLGLNPMTPFFYAIDVLKSQGYTLQVVRDGVSYELQPRHQDTEDTDNY